MSPKANAIPPIKYYFSHYCFFNPLYVDLIIENPAAIFKLLTVK